MQEHPYRPTLRGASEGESTAMLLAVVRWGEDILASELLVTGVPRSLAGVPIAWDVPRGIATVAGKLVALEVSGRGAAVPAGALTVQLERCAAVELPRRSMGPSLWWTLAAALMAVLLARGATAAAASEARELQPRGREDHGAVLRGLLARYPAARNSEPAPRPEPIIVPSYGCLCHRDHEVPWGAVGLVDLPWVTASARRSPVHLERLRAADRCIEVTGLSPLLPQSLSLRIDRDGTVGPVLVQGASSPRAQRCAERILRGQRARAPGSEPSWEVWFEQGHRWVRQSTTDRGPSEIARRSHRRRLNARR